MVINEEICNFDKWKMFGKRIDKNTNKAMMDHQGNKDSTTEVKESNTIAIEEPSEFLEISEQIQKHHDQMWTRQQVGVVGDTIEKIAKKDAESFGEKLSKSLKKIVEAILKDPSATPSKEQENEIKTEKKAEVNKVMDQVATEECKQLGDEAPSDGPLSEPLGVLKAWIGRTNMKAIAKSCIEKPQKCSWIPQCKRLKLEKQCDDTGACSNGCTSHKKDSACTNAPGCVWLEAPAPELEHSNDAVMLEGRCV
jgi:hypothetical protein